MKHVILPLEKSRRLPFYLAMEEWVAANMRNEECFFSWIVDDTVICGRNQDIDLEVNLDYCRAHGIDVVRRRSGGGCVYADRGNIMLSYITPQTEVVTTFEHFTRSVAAVLQTLGINARATGRNDIVVDGRKISGNAFYHVPGASIVHGTMLYRTKMEHMLNAITPSKAKLASKHVQSVESRIATVSTLRPDLSMADFHAALDRGLSDGDVLTLTEAQVAQIEQLEQRYYQPEWLWRTRRGTKNTASALCGQHTCTIPGAGTISVAVQLSPDKLRIADTCFSGDFFMPRCTETDIQQILTGVDIDAQRLTDALDKSGAEIAGLDNHQLAGIILQAVENAPLRK